MEKKRRGKKAKQVVKADAQRGDNDDDKKIREEEQPPEVSSASLTPSSASSTASSKTESGERIGSNRGPTTDVMESIFRLQQQQLEASLRQTALSQLKEMRPKTKFSGASNKKMDFEKHMKQFHEAMEILGVSKKQMLNEFQHWFEGSAFNLIKAETLRNMEMAVDKAVEKLTKMFGMRHDTALELLNEVLQGRAIGEKDHKGLLDFYAPLTSVHSLARETGRGSDW